MYERKEKRSPFTIKNEDSMELYPRDDGAWAITIVAKLKYGAITLEKRPVNRKL